MADSEPVNFQTYQRTQFPLVGVSIPELIAALALLPANAQIIQLETRRSGWLFVETGRYTGMRAGGGKHYLLQRTPNGWVVAEETTWRA